MKTASAAVRGFSLLELILVILIASLALALTYPSLSRGTSAFHLRATGRDIMNTLRYAREKAITEQTGMLVIADREQQQVSLSNAVGGEARSYALPDDIRITRLFLAGQEVSDGSLTIRFLPNGSSEIAEIRLESDKGGMLTVAADPLTGGARVILNR